MLIELGKGVWVDPAFVLGVAQKVSDPGMVKVHTAEFDVTVLGLACDIAAKINAALGEERRREARSDLLSELAGRRECPVCKAVGFPVYQDGHRLSCQKCGALYPRASDPTPAQISERLLEEQG